MPTIDTSISKHTNTNNKKTLFAAIYLSIVGPAIFIVQPAFLQGLVEQFNFSEQEAGYIAAAEMWGIAITTLVLTFFTQRVNWQRLIVISALIASAGNFLSISATDATTFAMLRCFTGIGSGALISLSFTILGLSANPDRNFGISIMCILIYGAIGFMLMPLAFATVGMTPVLIFFAILNLSAFAVIKYLPVSANSHLSGEETSSNTSIQLKLLAVATMLLYFAAQGAVWAYFSLIGNSAGLTDI